MNLKKKIFVILTTAATLFLLTAAQNAQAMVYIDINAPAGKKLPIAIQEIVPIDTSPGDMGSFQWYKEELESALTGDLEFTQIFDVIDKEAFLEDTTTSGLTSAKTDFYQWRAIGADMLIKGGIKIRGTLIIAEFRLFDTVRERHLLARRYNGRAQDIRMIAHKFASAVLEKLTGEKGSFTSRIAFVSNKSGTKELYISDYDGANLRRVTTNNSINLTPKWSPDGKSLSYTSYKNGGPYLYEINLKTNRGYALSKKPGMNIGGRWAPDGRRIALTVSSKKSPELYVLDRVSSTYTKLTDNYGIDVSPTWSPDGKRIAFVSDIAGNPHIYMIDSNGGRPMRLTHQGKYNADPSWSPDGRLIAFSRSTGGAFNIWVMKTDGKGQRRLTGGRDDKTPSWSPDGRHIIFSGKNKSGGTSLYIMRSDGSGMKELNPTTGSESDPAWSPAIN